MNSTRTPLPNRIWLQWAGDDCDCLTDDPHRHFVVDDLPDGTTWCDDPVFNADVEYVRVRALPSRLAADVEHVRHSPITLKAWRLRFHVPCLDEGGTSYFESFEQAREQAEDLLCEWDEFEPIDVEIHEMSIDYRDPMQLFMALIESEPLAYLVWSHPAAN